jgi:hypothetical protein
VNKRPMIFTTNKPLNQWGTASHDEDLAAAILKEGSPNSTDRPSGRTRHLQLEGGARGGLGRGD